MGLEWFALDDACIQQGQRPRLPTSPSSAGCHTAWCSLGSSAALWSPQADAGCTLCQVRAFLAERGQTDSFIALFSDQELRGGEGHVPSVAELWLEPEVPEETSAGLGYTAGPSVF